MKRFAFVAPLFVAVGLWGAVAFAQPQPGQPGQPQPQPGQAQPGQPGGLPAGHPRLDLPPQGRQPGGFPPGALRPQQQPRPLAQPTPAHREEEHAGGHGGGHCPGHGPNDAPHFEQINWWHGMIAVNNEKAAQGGFLNQLLWRYDNHTDACDPKNEAPPFLASLLNIGLLGLIVYRFGKKPVAEALLKRKQSIMSEIDTASSLLAASEKRLEQYESKFEHLEDTLAEVKAEYAAQAELEKKQIVIEAEERRVRMVRDAEFRVEQELRAARIELMHEAVIDATSMAEEIIRKRAAQADFDRMSEEYLGSLRAAFSGSSSLPGGQ